MWKAKKLKAEKIVEATEVVKKKAEDRAKKLLLLWEKKVAEATEAKRLQEEKEKQRKLELEKEQEEERER